MFVPSLRLFFSLYHHHKTGHFKISNGYLTFIFLFTLNEAFFCIVGYTENRRLTCEATRDVNPCTFRKILFGLIFSASIILLLYISAIAIFRFMSPGLLRPSNFRIEPVDLERRGLELRPLHFRSQNGHYPHPASFSTRPGRPFGQKIPPPLDLTMKPFNYKPVLVDIPLGAT
ncbi:hypothetical protein K439DRAFT_269287 [Ramaria rubella]|nr:hypothetical protein K439DRAFT_269287 [Ramaria rubella]